MWEQDRPSGFLDHPILPSGPIPLPYKGEVDNAAKAEEQSKDGRGQAEATRQGTGETVQPRMPDNLLVADDDSQEDDQDDKVASNDCFFDDEELDADAPLFLQPGDPDKIRQLRK